MPEPQSVSFFVAGTPAPQGSKIPVKRGNTVVLIEAAKGFKAWRDAVKAESAQARNRWFILFESAVRVNMTFVLVKPPTTKYKLFPAGKPDLDKLCRNTADGLTGDLLKDDSLIVELHAIKRWAEPGEPTGCWIDIITV